MKTIEQNIFVKLYLKYFLPVVMIFGFFFPGMIHGQNCVSCPNAIISGQNASAIGSNATASGVESIAIGQNSLASNIRSVSIGNMAKSQGMSSFALGNLVNTTAANAFTLGLGTADNLLVNNIANSFMVGFNSNLPTLFVSSSNGFGTTGRVGIGTSAPSEKLSVNGLIYSMSGGIKFPDGSIQETKAVSIWQLSNSGAFFNNGNVGVGTSAPVGKLDVYGDIVLGKPGENFILHSRPWIGDALIIAPQNDNSGWEWSKGICLKDNGQVYIGSEMSGNAANADYKLAVNGKIVTREVVVTAQDWADFVFEKSYPLIKLEEVDEYIRMNGHLPGVPGKGDVLQNGIEMGKLNVILLKKIEELTLYLIEHKQMICNLEQKISSIEEERLHDDY
jgi:hypothetical protein